MSRDTLITDPHGLIMALDADAISARLAELDGEADALRVLLRAVRARQRMRRQDNDSARRRADR